MIRLLKRCRARFKELNNHSDRVTSNGSERTPQVERHYRLAKRLIADIEKELRR